jgi:hypothetical protein
LKARQPTKTIIKMTTTTTTTTTTATTMKMMMGGPVHAGMMADVMRGMVAMIEAVVQGMEQVGDQGG